MSPPAVWHWTAGVSSFPVPVVLDTVELEAGTGAAAATVAGTVTVAGAGTQQAYT